MAVIDAQRFTPFTLIVLCFFLFSAYPSAGASDSSPSANTSRSPNIDMFEVREQKQIDHIVSQFNSQLDRLGLNRIITCSRITQLRYQYVTGRPGYSYGANCVISNGKHKSNVLVCEEPMIGKFALSGGSGSRALSDVGTFVENNCPSGGG